MTTKVWIGNAKAVRQVDRLTPASAEIGDTFNVTINGKTVSYTADYDDLVDDATYGIIPTLCAKLATDLTTAGLTYPEFAEITWLAEANVDGWVSYLTAYGPTDGKPVTITSAAVNVSGGLGVRVEATTEGSATANEVQTITILGVATGGTFTVSYNGVAGTGTVAWNAAAATLETELDTIAALSGNVTVTGSAGGPWTVTFNTGLALTDVQLIVCNGASLTGANTQTFATSSVTTPAGPNWFTTAANWSGGVAPVDDDTLVFENSGVSCLYGLSNASTTPDTINVRASFTGNIGLPKFTGRYYEYRDTELLIGTTADGANPILTVNIGQGDGSGSQLIRINTNTKKTALSVYLSNRGTEANAPAINWRGTHADNVVRLSKGSLGVAFFAGQTATVATVQQGYVTAQTTDTALYLGSGATVTTLTKSGGTLQTESAIASLTQSAGTTWLNGSAAPSALTITGGVVYSNTTGTLGKYGTITGITQADPAVVTSNGHGLAAGDHVRITGSDMTEVNDLDFIVGVVAANTFELLAVDSSAYVAVGTSGTWAKRYSVVVSSAGLLDFTQSLADRKIAAQLIVYNRNSWNDRAKSVSTLTYPAGQFAVDYIGCSPADNMGEGLFVRT